MVTTSGENLVFIFSLPRSGSTLLSLLLSGHSDIYCPPEPWFLLKLVNLKSHASYERVFNDDLATIGTQEFLDDATLFEAAGAFATKVYNRKLAVVDKPIFVDKTPRYYHIIDEIDKIFPKAKKIWLKRNPLDTAYSFKTTWDMGPDVITGDRMNSYTFDFGIGLFRLADFFEKESSYKMQIKYEDLVSSPLEVLQQLCNFIGVHVDSRMLAYAENQQLIEEHRFAIMGDKKIYGAGSIHEASVGKGLLEFSIEELEQILSVLGLKIFDRMNYGDVSRILLNKKLKLPSESEASEKRNLISNKNADVVKSLTDQLHICSVELNVNVNKVAALQSSLSWRITKPLRSAGDWMGRWLK